MMGSITTTEWIRPTIRATPISPLATITTCLVLIAAVVSLRTDQIPDLLVRAAAGGMAGGVALGLEDAARSTLRSSPTSALVRLGHRLLILLPGLAVACLVLVVVERLLFDQRAMLPSITAVMALVASGISIEVWWIRNRPEGAAEGAVVATMTWALARFVTPDVAAVRFVTGAWHDKTPWVLTVAIGLVLVGVSGRGS